MDGGIYAGNDQFVGRRADGTIQILAPKAFMTRAEALRHAAWLVAVTMAEDDEFLAVLAAVRST